MTKIEKSVAPEPESIHPVVTDIRWRDAPRIIASGACMGTADLVPGVSGGTMAVALGIYREFLAAITSVNAESIRALLQLRFARAHGAALEVHRAWASAWCWPCSSWASSSVCRRW